MLIEGPRGADGFLDRGLGDGVEGDAAVLALAQELADVPGDGLALAVGVGGEDDLLRVLDQSPQLGDVAAGAFQHLVGGGDLPILEGDGQPSLGGKVSHMAERRGDAVLRAEHLLDLPDLVGRLDDDEFHRPLTMASSASTRFSSSVSRSTGAGVAAARGATDAAGAAGEGSPEKSWR